MQLLSKLGLSSTCLQGKVAVVTGAGRGIGEHTSRALAQLGARVILADISESGAEISQSIKQTGGLSYFIQIDVGEEADIKRLVAEAESHFGQIDILINNAARLKTGSVIDLPIEYWDTCFRTNLRGPVLAIKHIVPGMILRKHGVVISLISLEGMPFLGSYCANKMGLRSMMLSLGKEVTPELGVSIFSVVPGSVDTPLIHEIAETLAASFGITVADVMASLANNPGYEGLVPVEHTAASLAWFVANAAQFHGQFIDGYLPLSKSGVIDVGSHAEASTEGLSAPDGLPNPEMELQELVHINRSLENRIDERTRELTLLSQELQAQSLALKEANAQLSLLSYRDGLTQLANRRSFDETLEAEFQRLRRRKAPLSLIMLDIDYFKNFNDTHGHVAGDECLRRVAEIIGITINRVPDTAARYGGEEFAAILPETNAQGAAALAERLREGIANLAIRHSASSVADYVTVSLGVVTVITTDIASSVEIVKLADEQLYLAKSTGRNRVVATEVT
jgi:diguanylate cyclase (GGDEF)-like protein